MNKLSVICIAALALNCTYSCQNKSRSDNNEGSPDSVRSELAAKSEELDCLNGTIGEIASSLDSIAAKEQILYNSGKSEGGAVTRQQIINNLNALAEIVARQRSRMNQLQDSLSHAKSSAASIAKLQRVIEFLNNQLAEKDRLIQSLRADVNNKNKDITQLRASLTAMRTKTEKVEKRAEVLTQAVATQDEVMNECYVRIGTRKQLQQAGLLKGGFLKKRRVDYQTVDKSKFQSVDIRRFREVTLKSSNPKILTPLPNNRSYHFEENGDGTCVLVITNPTIFWSVSNFLIIQL